MSHWTEHLLTLLDSGGTGVLVTVAEARGSTPRSAGTKMLVSQHTCYGTIGGGNLEHKAIEIARTILAEPMPVAPSFLRRFPLGPSLGQCCGGVAVLSFETVSREITGLWSCLQTLIALRRTRRQAVIVSSIGDDAEPDKLIVTADDYTGELFSGVKQQEVIASARQILSEHAGTKLQPCPCVHDENPGENPGENHTALLFEPLDADDFQIILFGAGHVGRALVQVLSGLPCHITWVDSRAHEFPPDLPANISVELSDAPEYDVAAASPGSYFLVMTHSHALDQLICECILQRADFAYCGLIGSVTKLRKFHKRMRARGLSEALLARLTCPIGVTGISGKHPAAIAIAVAAELLQVYEQEWMEHNEKQLFQALSD